MLRGTSQGTYKKPVCVGGQSQEKQMSEEGEAPVLIDTCLHGVAAGSVGKREILRHNFITRIKLWYVLNEKILSNILINIMDLTNYLCNNNLLKIHGEIKTILRGK